MADRDKPRLFLVDIQEHQLDELQRMAAHLGVELQTVAPFVRAHITGHNGCTYIPTTAADEPGAESDDQLRNRAINLTYRNSLYPSERVLQGHPFPGGYNNPTRRAPVQMSVEQRYAERQGLRLGDVLSLDVFGMPLTVQVVNIRTVKWTDFVPNFFLLLQNGAVNDAPKTYLATLPPGDYDVSDAILALADAFPNITAVDVKYVIANVLELVQAITAVLHRMTLLSVVIGFLIIAIILHHQMTLRRSDIERLKLIGVKLAQIRRSFMLEFLVLAVTATLAGVLLASGGAWAVSRYLFQEPWVPNLPLLLAIAVVVPLTVVAIVTVLTRWVTQQRETTLFGEG